MADLLKKRTADQGIPQAMVLVDLEPAATAATARYLLAEIQSDLDWCWARGLKLMVMIQDKTFVMENPLPQYLAHKAIPNRNGGYTALRWDPLVASRMSRLMNAIASRFKNHSAFEGLGAEETAPSLSSDNWLRTITRQRSISTPTCSRPSRLRLSHPTCATSGTSTSCQASRIRPSMWCRARWVVRSSSVDRTATLSMRLSADGVPGVPEGCCRARADIDLFLGNQLRATKADGTYMTMQQVFDFARTKLKVSYAFWTPMGNPWTSPKRRFADACVVIGNTRTWTGG